MIKLHWPYKKFAGVLGSVAFVGGGAAIGAKLALMTCGTGTGIAGANVGIAAGTAAFGCAVAPCVYGRN